MYKTLFLISCLLCALYVSADPVSITKCNAKDSKCIKESAQSLLPIFVEGIPEFNVGKLDPLIISDTIDASSPSLKLKVKNSVVRGLKNCVVKKVERDVAKSKLTTKFLCTVRSTGDYEMDGQILILPISGKGKSEVVLNKLLIEVISDLSDRTGRDGKKHWSVKSFRYNYELLEKAQLKFDNLFNGSETLARAANNIIETNANEILKEIGDPFLKKIVGKVVEEVNHLYRALPAEELALD